MRTVAATIEIEAPPMDVWAVLTDLSRYREWNPQIREAAGEIAVGSRVRFRMSPPTGRPVTIRPKVVTAEPGVELRLLGSVPGIFSGEHCFVLTPLDGGACTRVVQSETYRGILVPFIGKTIASAQRGFEEHNEALKKRVEAR